jgi:hypothetical protein
MPQKEACAHAKKVIRGSVSPILIFCQQAVDYAIFCLEYLVIIGRQL